MRPVNRLTVSSVKSMSQRGRYSDGAGLYLYVAPGGSKSWVYRWKVNGRRRELGLGGFPAVSLAKARERAGDARGQLLEGIDPIATKKRSAEPNFAECVDKFLGSMESQWRNDKHKKQWRMTLTEYCKPMASLPVSKIDTQHILSVLNPIWREKPETASRLRGRIERVLDYASIHGWRSGANPAVWRGHLKSVLPARQRLSRGHHAAINYKELPTLFAKLGGSEGQASRALRFLILTAARTSEVLGATHTEVDGDQKVWMVPADRMKAGKEHRVPLSDVALELTNGSNPSSNYIFNGSIKDKPLSNMAMSQLLKRLGYPNITVHGMRSAFRDWVGEETQFPREIAEAALAHRVGNAVEQAYRRKDGLEKRRTLMSAWESFLMRKDNGKVVQLHTPSHSG